MELIKIISFQFEWRDYEVKVFKNGWRYTVRVFLNGVPANGYEYSVEETTSYDFCNHTGVSGVSHLIEMAQADVRNKVWENYLAALKALKNDRGVQAQPNA